MTTTTVRALIASCSVAAAMTLCAGAAVAQTQFKPGFNLYTPEQDQEIGKQSAAEAERQLPILNDQAINAYVGRVGKRLAAVAPGARYPYQFKVVNASDINAFALPGGYMYVNRGLIEAAQNEGQLAGVMAHEMAHVALRHGTSQASKAYLGQAGLGLLGGLLGKDDRSTEQTIAAIGGFGLNALFLKYSRAAEEQADVAGAQMMAAAGYNPADMVSFFEILANEQNRNPTKVEQFFSSHPAPANRAARIRQEMALLKVKPISPVGGFAQAKSALARMRPAASMQQIAEGRAAPAPAPRSGSTDRTVPEIAVDGPSADYRVFEQRDGLFQISYPDNWRTYEAGQGYGVIIAPEGGFVDTGGRERALVSGVVVNHYDPLDDDASDRFGDGRNNGGLVEGNSSLVFATNDLVAHILRTNPEMKMVADSERRTRVDGAPALSVVLSGRSPVTRREERITLFARELPDEHVVYALFVAAQQDYERLNETFNHMISSLQISEDATHDSNVGRRSGNSLSGGDQGVGSAVSGGNQAVGRSASAGSQIVVPTGTVLMVSFAQLLSSASSQPGDPFTARVVEPVVVNGRVAIPAGSTIAGKVVAVQPAQKVGGKAQLNLEFTSLRSASGRASPISASLHSEGKNQTTRDAATIGGAAVGGAVLGHALGKDRKSTVLGALVGGAIGTGIAARNMGEDVALPEGTAVAIHLDSPFAG